MFTSSNYFNIMITSRDAKHQIHFRGLIQMLTTNFMGYKIIKSKTNVSIIKNGVCVNITSCIKSAISHVCDIEQVQDRSFIR